MIRKTWLLFFAFVVMTVFIVEKVYAEDKKPNPISIQVKFGKANDKPKMDISREKIAEPIPTRSAGGYVLNNRSGIQKGIVENDSFATSEAIPPREQKPSQNLPATNETQNGQEYMPGKVSVKFKEGVDIPKAIEKIRRSYDISRVEKTFKKYRVSEAIQREIESREKPPIKKGLSTDLSRWYQLEFVDKDSDAKALAEALKQSRDIEYAEPNYKVYYASTTPNDSLFGPSQWNLRKIRGPEAWDIETGSPAITIAIVDLGIDYDHPDIAAKIVGGFNILDSVDANGDGDYDDPDDIPVFNATDHLEGHGTRVGGIAAANTNRPSAEGIAGVDWHAKLMPVKVDEPPDFPGGGTDAVAKGIQYAADHGARVINLSLGTTQPAQKFRDAVNYAYYGKGCVLVAAMGNLVEGLDRNTIIYPAGWPEAIAVGATDSNDQVWERSLIGSHIDVVAPGVNVISPDHGALCCSYKTDSGTSYSTAHVSGLASLILGADRYVNGRQLNNVEVGNIIRNAALDIGTPGFDIYSGRGRIDAQRALRSTNVIPQYVQGHYNFCGSFVLSNPDSPPPSSCYNVREPFYQQDVALDDDVVTGLHLRNVTRTIKMQVRYILPNSVNEIVDDETDWVQGGGGYVWGIMFMPLERIPLNPEEKAGKWVIKQYIKEREGTIEGPWLLVDSKTFTVNDSFTFVRATMAKGVDLEQPFYPNGGARFEPIDESSRFTIPAGETAYAWAHLTSIYSGLEVIFEWTALPVDFPFPYPSSIRNTLTIPDPSEEGLARWNWYKVADAVELPPFPATWRVRILVDDGMRSQPKLLDTLTVEVTPANSCTPCDLNGDGTPSGNDDLNRFQEILLGMGPAPTPQELCAADFNHDGVVDGSDVQGWTDQCI